MHKGVEAALCAWLGCGAAGWGGAPLCLLQAPCCLLWSTSVVAPVGIWEATGWRALFCLFLSMKISPVHLVRGWVLWGLGRFSLLFCRRLIFWLSCRKESCLLSHSAPQRRKLLFQLQALMESLNPQMLTFSEWGLYTNYKNVFVTYVTAAK